MNVSARDALTDVAQQPSDPLLGRAVLRQLRGEEVAQVVGGRPLQSVEEGETWPHEARRRSCRSRRVRTWHAANGFLECRRTMQPDPFGSRIAPP
jgi:hypothetical protein